VSLCSYCLLAMHILTWNIWGIPYAAPKMLSRPLRCGDRIGDTVKEVDVNDISIICVQEAWGWGAGLCWPLLKVAQWLESLPGCLWYLSYPVYSLGALGILFPVPPRWEPKPHIARRIAAASGRILGETMFVVGDKGDSQDYCHGVLDSGLMLLLSVQPTLTGFSRFHTKSHDDAFANKGYLWAFIQDKNMLAVTTHLQASGGEEVKQKQLLELRKFLDMFAAGREGLQVMVAGDFNLETSRIIVAEEILGLKCLTTPATSDCLDHVLGNFKDFTGVTSTQNVVALDHLSDHPLVQLTQVRG